MAENLENSKDNSNRWGGAREGAGRPKGKENEDTKLRREADRTFKDRVAKSVDKLFNSQLDLAVGEKYLMVKRTEGEGKNRKTWTEIVDDPETIRQYLDDELDDTDDEYYYMTTKPANNMAIDSLMNRAFGKPKESINHMNNGESFGVSISADQAEQLIRARARRSNI